MPIVEPGSEAFHGFDISQPFRSELHSDSLLSGTQVSPFFADLVQSTAIEQQWKNFSRLSRIGVGNLAMTAGIIQIRADAFSELFKAAPKITARNLSEAAAELGKRIGIEGALLVFDDALSNVASKAPMVGWIVQLGLFVYDSIRNAVANAKADPPPPQARAVVYDKARDEELTALALDRFKDRDWTELFLPQSRPDDVCITTLDYTSRGIKEGIAWEVCSTSGSWGWGLTPGLSSKFSGCCGFYQSAFKVTGSSRPEGVGGITTFGELHPSIVQLGMLAWQMCNKNSEAAFRIDGDRIASAWHDHFGTLWDYAQNDAANEWRRSQIAGACQWWDPRFERSWIDGKTPDDFPSRYITGNRFWYSQLIAYKIEQGWKKRLPGYLETITCAYVSPNAPALKVDTALAKKHRDMRVLLLDHAARRNVELDLIPDREYREDMRRAQLTIEPVITAREGDYLPKSFGWLDSVPPVDPKLGAPVAPDEDPAPGLSSFKASPAEGDAGVLLMVAAVLAGLLLD